ncbi:hypothetical protein DPMN_093446 [Dreissena polymorpha]|uniref:Uncharacterized protein n=1 Tax=Dreissena polymorpha TaxID=45954 RepID=A0A9D4L2Y5_DREPO|nr:hypothetical protein DPMN_093446 [Dreissena polymorpha]
MRRTPACFAGEEEQHMKNMKKKLDANSAYCQVRIKEEDRPKTAFVTKNCLFEHVKMGFGLCNAPCDVSLCSQYRNSGLELEKRSGIP